jgi:hypothetical protein
MFFFWGGQRFVGLRLSLARDETDGNYEADGISIAALLGKVSWLLWVGKKSCDVDRRRHDASYIPMASTELRDGKKQAHGFWFSGEWCFWSWLATSSDRDPDWHANGLLQLLHM